MQRKREAVRVLETNFTPATRTEVERKMWISLKRGQSLLVTFRNPHYVLRARKTPDLNSVLDGFHYVLPDGWGVLLGARLLLTPLPEQICAEDFLATSAEIGRAFDRPVLFIGGPRSASDRFANLLRRSNFRSRFEVIDGFGFDLFGEELAQRLEKLRPVVVFASLGAPLQERWLRWAQPHLRAAIGITAGGMVEKLGLHGFDRPLLRRLHIQWLYLSIRSPRRFVDRYFFGIPMYLKEVLRERRSPRQKNG